MCPCPPAPKSHCAFCGSRFEQHTGPGRPSAYCGNACQRRSQRHREKQRALLRDLGAPAAAVQRLRALVEELADQLEAGAGDELRFSVAGKLAAEAARVAGAAAAGQEGVPTGVAPDPAFGAAVGELGKVLAALHRAAGQPAVGGLADTTGLPVQTVRAALEGSWALAWADTASLARALDAYPGLVRPAWERVHYHFLNAADAFPAAGLPARPATSRAWS